MDDVRCDSDVVDGDCDFYCLKIFIWKNLHNKVKLFRAFIALSLPRITTSRIKPENIHILKQANSAIKLSSTKTRIVLYFLHNA